MSLYKGSQKIKDIKSYGVYKGSIPIGAIYKGSQKIYIFKKQTTFNPSASFQKYTVPNYVNKIHVDCVAASGHNNGGGFGGKGGRVQCDLIVSPNQVLYLWVPQNPTGQAYSSTLAYNAADIRTNNAGLLDNTSLQSRLIVAGGGGETYPNTSEWGAGGAGGGLTGAAGGSVGFGGGGQGGTQTAGGAGGDKGGGLPGGYGKQGSFGLGGTSWASDWRGIGGAGWYGGGSGGASTYYGDGQGGGGGGSSYTNSTLCSNVVHTQGYRNGAGYITITEIG